MRNWSNPLTKKTSYILLVLLLIYITALFWKTDYNSCVRQQAPRDAGNARKLAVDAIAKASYSEMTAKERMDVMIKTQTIPKVPTLQCAKVFPDTK